MTEHGMCVVYNIVYMGAVDDSNNTWYVLLCVVNSNKK